MMKTKYGEEIDPNDFPFAGQFGDYVRKNIDSEWGMEKKRKYEVYLNAVAEVSAWTTVEAESEENAEEIAKEKLKENLSDWNIDTLGKVAVWDIEEEDDTDD